MRCIRLSQNDGSYQPTGVSYPGDLNRWLIKGLYFVMKNERWLQEIALPDEEIRDLPLNNCYPLAA